MSIGERIRIVRTNNKLKVLEFAEIFNMTQGNISKIERSELRPSPDMLSKICLEWNISGTWLLTGKGDMFNSDMVTNEISTSGGIPKDAYKSLLLDIVQVVDEAVTKSGRKIEAEQKRKISEYLYDAWIEIKGYDKPEIEQEESNKVIDLKDFIKYNLPLALKIINTA